VVTPPKRTTWNFIMTSQRDDMYQTPVRVLRATLPGAIAGLLMFAATAADAQDGTPAQRRACEPDVFRLCRDFIPDHTAITDCLERSRAKLSPACRAVFSPPAK
jgi:hypothetical protein